MYQEIILLLLISTISTKTNLISSTIEFDIKQPFDNNNHEFTFSNEAEEAKFFLVEIKTTENLKYEYQCQGSNNGTEDVSKIPVFIMKAQTGECSINIFSSSSVIKAGGTIEVHPLEREFPIDLDKMRFEMKK